MKPVPSTAETLKSKQRELRETFPSDFGLKVHRAISWVKRAEQEGHDDLDAAFIFYWIAFNAAYASDNYETQISTERSVFSHYFNKLVAVDKDKQLEQLVWSKYTSSIRLILNNEFVFTPFWKHHNGHKGYENWQYRLTTSKRAVNKAIAEKETGIVLSILFDRYYMLRNQLLHGGATWNSSINRDQIRDAVDFISELLPIIIDLMMDNANMDWGEPYYPVIER